LSSSIRASGQRKLKGSIELTEDYSGPILRPVR
jgi:hypothetical protein